MHYTLLRNAAALLELGGRKFLIDPALDPAGARPPVPNTPNQKPNPLVELSGGWEGVVDSADTLVVTHLHQDHFDPTSASYLDKHLPLLCQAEDVDRLQAQGFDALQPVEAQGAINGVTVTRTAGHHGTGEIGRLMAPVSGFVFEAPGEPVVYLAGDTIWCEEVAAVIEQRTPDVIVVNASGARFLQGDPIVMTVEDVAEVHRAAPNATVIVVHLEAINHCLETRDHYRQRLPELGVNMERIVIPDDGARVSLT
jgi:L-ascorbate metabolism protein UlaG (beta-lactamase superfamily)